MTICNKIAAWCNGSARSLHGRGEGSIPSAATKILNKFEGPKGVSVPQGNSPHLFLNSRDYLYEKYYCNPVAASYSIDFLF